MTPADTLHRAATKLREEATAAWGELCLPPWRYGNSWAGAHTVMCQDGHPLAVFGEDVGGSPGLVEAQARYAATVHPGVGLLLADLLDRAADYADHRAEELAVARAILGTDQHDAGGPA